MSSLIVGTFNAHSLVAEGRIEELERHLLVNGIDICLIQETFLSPKHVTDMNEFVLFRTDRRTRGGGTAIAVRKGLDGRVVPIESLAQLKHIEATAVMIKLERGKKLFCLSVYNPRRVATMDNEVRRMFEKLCFHRPENLFILGGDCNAHNTTWNSSRTTMCGRRLWDFVEGEQTAYNTRLLASRQPSRPVSGSYIDLFLISASIQLMEPSQSVNILPSHHVFGDHDLVVLKCTTEMELENDLDEEEGRFRLLRRGVRFINPKIFKSEMITGGDSFSPRELTRLAERNLSTSELDLITEAFSSLILSAMEASMARSVSKRPTVFIPAGIRPLLEEKRSLVRVLFLLYRAVPRDEQRIRELRRDIKSLKMQITRVWAEFNWETEKKKLDRINCAKPEDFFRELNSIYNLRSKGSGHEESFILVDTEANRRLARSTTPVALSDNKFLITGADVDCVLRNSLEDTFNPSDCNVIRSSSAAPKIVFGNGVSALNIGDEDERFMTMEDLNNLISRISNKQSSGPDGIPNCVIKLLPRVSRSFLLIILNTCINLGRVPDLWKISSVVFIKKNRSIRNNPSNYRPISMLCNFSKLLEAFFTDKLEAEIEKKSLISKNQFGFRKGKSTVHAIGSLVNSIQQQRVNGLTVGVIFVDLTKAFDSVDHGLLLGKMRALQINPNIVDFFLDFLTGRTFISKRDADSALTVGDISLLPGHAIGRGVLQGSISGPVLFTLFIDEVLRRVAGSTAYADDLAILTVGEELTWLQDEMQKKMWLLEDIIGSHRLTINMDKTKIVLFRDALTNSEGNEVRNFTIRGRGTEGANGMLTFGIKIEVVASYNYLGVVLDTFLTFHAHVEKAIALANKSIGALSKVLRLQGLDLRKKVWLYKTVIRPILCYGCPAWIMIPSRDMRKILQVEYRTVRAMCGLARRPNGWYYSYRSRLIEARMEGIDYHIIKLVKRYLTKLSGSDCATADYSKPNWHRALRMLQGGCITQDSFAYADSLGIVQRNDLNVFYSLTGNCFSMRIDLAEALSPSIERQRNYCRVPTEYDIKISSQNLDTPWSSWICPSSLLAHYIND